MSEDTGTDTAVLDAGTETAEQGGQTTQQSDSSRNLLSGNDRSTSPFDALFQEGAIDQLPSNLQNWVKMQKNGLGIETGLQYLQKKHSEKGFERPPEDADEETVKAFEKKMRQLKAVPEKVEDFDFKMPDGYDEALTPEIKSKIAEWAIDKGHSPRDVEDFLPFQMELEKQAREQHITQETEKASELFVKDNLDFDQLAPGLKDFIEAQGYDFSRPAFRNAETWHLAHRLQQLLGEDTHVSGERLDTANSQADSISKRINEILSPESSDGKIFSGKSHDPSKRALLQKEYLSLSKQLSELKRK